MLVVRFGMGGALRTGRGGYLYCFVEGSCLLIIVTRKRVDATTSHPSSLLAGKGLFHSLTIR